jgi:hypothetical protein
MLLKLNGGRYWEKEEGNLKLELKIADVLENH